MRLIDADKLLTKVVPINVGLYTETQDVVFAKDIESSPVVDAVPVVRCKDCGFYNASHSDRFLGRCEFFECSTGESLFCALGRKKEVK